MQITGAVEGEMEICATDPWNDVTQTVSLRALANAQLSGNVPFANYQAPRLGCPAGAHLCVTANGMFTTFLF